MDVLTDPFAAITADGHRLIGGETVTFGRRFWRFTRATVETVDGPMVWLRLGKTRRELVPAGWVTIQG